METILKIFGKGGSFTPEPEPEPAQKIMEVRKPVRIRTLSIGTY
jgi:hypothetical protein